MEYEQTQPVQGTPEDYQNEEAFARVWRRVMPRDRPDCPFLLGRPKEEGAALPVPASAGACHVAAGSATEEDVPCLGASSLSYAPLLQRFVDRSTAQWRLYQSLSRRAGPMGARTLGGLASAEYTHAKRLATACFLITGVRYWPADRSGWAAPSGAVPALLRGAFQGEQRSAASFLGSAAESTDPALRALFLELAEEEADHADVIRRLLEQL